MKKILKKILDLNLTCLEKEISSQEKKTFEAFLKSLINVYVVFRCIDDEYLYKQYITTTGNISLLSELIFLYGDKGKIFYEELDQKTFNIDINEFGERENSFIYEKMQKIFIHKHVSSHRTLEAIERFNTKEPAFVTFWYNISKDQWIQMMANFSQSQRILVKDYYTALLHTVGLAGYGRNSYFLSTSLNPKIHQDMQMAHSIEIIGWTNKSDLHKYGVNYFKERNKEISKLGLPVISNTVFLSQKEVSYKCGILPHFIIGYLYNKGECLEINPCVFKKQDFSCVEEQGLPVDQNEFYKKLNNTNYKSTYIKMDDLFFQIW